jgi:uncharacterized membrane protein YqgA involved in biofilm formation
MLGPAVNAAAIVVCALAGRFLVRGIPERFEEIIKKAIGFNFLGTKEIRVANLIPAVFIPWAYLGLETILQNH